MTCISFASKIDCASTSQRNVRKFMDENDFANRCVTPCGQRDADIGIMPLTQSFFEKTEVHQRCLFLCMRHFFHERTALSPNRDGPVFSP